MKPSVYLADKNRRFFAYRGSMGKGSVQTVGKAKKLFYKSPIHNKKAVLMKSPVTRSSILPGLHGGPCLSGCPTSFKQAIKMIFY
ncbi:hypothetical protein J2S09_005540 [Bacillus fengqiuensis]|nr:hypothetical protein [Bacillus fengqiuensis]